MAQMVLPENNLTAFLEACFYFVEADSFAMYALWHIHVGFPAKEEFRIPYIQVPHSWLHTVGGDTRCSFNFAYVYGKLVCFYYPTSRRIDWADVEAFMEPYTKNKENKCHAQSYEKCIKACKK